MEFENSKPSKGDIEKFLRRFNQNFENSNGGILRSTDPHTGDSFSIDLETTNAIRLEVPSTATFRSVAAVYATAWALADKFAGKLKDPQLGGTPSLDLARLEWRNRGAAAELSKIFGGSMPSDLPTRIKQRRGPLSQEVNIRGSELEVYRSDRGRSERYTLPILSLGSMREKTVPNPYGILLVIAGVAILYAAAFVGRPLGGELFVVSILVIPLSLVLFYKIKRKLFVFPGQGGTLLLEASSPSRREVVNFLSSIDRVRFAMSRYQPPKLLPRPDIDSEDMRVA